ncbi:MAG: hypothetical protein RLZZ383_639 [Pseudomonadota bacterium]
MAPAPGDGGPIRTTSAPAGPTLSRATPLQRRGTPLWVASDVVRNAGLATRHALIALANRPWDDLQALADRAPEVLLAEFARRDAAEDARRDATRWGVATSVASSSPSQNGPATLLLLVTSAGVAATWSDTWSATVLALVGCAAAGWSALRARTRRRARDTAWEARRAVAMTPLPAGWDQAQTARRASLDEPDVERQGRAWHALDEGEDVPNGDEIAPGRDPARQAAAQNRLTER